jgi:uncharacterized protein (DUF362 family)
MKNDHYLMMNRRDFFKTSLTGAAALSTIKPKFLSGQQAAGKTVVAVVKTMDRAQGVKDVLRLLSFPSPKGKSIFIKPNFNTTDPAPGSTHNDTLRRLILEMKARGTSRITLGESSGPPPTNKVMEENGSGGHFSMSIKLAVGLTPKAIRRELHSKRDTDMRKMIAELNLSYKPKIIVMDGVEAFVDGGPSRGKKVDAGVFIGGTDRVAVDAVGLAILKELGSNQTIMGRKIFEQDQIQRAVEIGLGISRPDQIELVTPDNASRDYAEKIKPILGEG